MKNTTFLFLTLLFLTFHSTTYTQSTIDEIKNDISILSSDEYQGREAGTKYSKKSAEYIANRMQQIGLSPISEKDGFIQEFDLNFPVIFEKASLNILNFNFNYPNDISIADFSDSGEAKGNIYVLKKNKRNYCFDNSDKKIENKIVLLDICRNQDIKNNSDYCLIIYNQLLELEKNGALGIIIYNSEKNENHKILFGSAFSKSLKIPVIFINDLSYNKIKNWNNKYCTINTKIKRTTTKNYNVVGQIKQNSNKTVVIGAHHDHLGVKLNKVSNKPEIYNGADDNASGIAMMLQLAQWMLNNESINYNYVFVAFDAEEKGLWGSKYFCNNNYINNDSIYYMLNLDMLGSYGVLGDSIQIYGLKTSRVWSDLLDNIENYGFGIKRKNEAPPMSDHASFYNKNIPTLFITTGLHENYHKPSDDVEDINLKGMIKVFQYIKEFIRKSERLKDIPFSNVSDF